jgi:hypothetical protein
MQYADLDCPPFFIAKLFSVAVSATKKGAMVKVNQSNQEKRKKPPKYFLGEEGTLFVPVFRRILVRTTMKQLKKLERWKLLALFVLSPSNFSH